MKTKEFERALVEIISKQPFFRRLLLETIFDEDTNIPTACVVSDGRFLINPEWFKGLSDCDRIFVILHEVLHIALCHFTRLGQRNKVLWNVATDLAINSMLSEMGFKVDKLKEVSLFPERFKLDKCLSAEEYYKLLLEMESQIFGKSGNNGESNNDKKKEDKEGKEDKGDKEGKEGKERGVKSDRKEKGIEKGKSGEGKGIGKEKSDEKEKDDKEKESKTDKFKGFDEHKTEKESQDKKEKADEIERKYKRVLISAYEEAKKQKGSFPGWFEELIEELKEPKLNWKSMLRKFCIQNIRIKTDWTKPNRRYFAYDIIYPSRGDKMLNLVVAVDTSGSISSEDLKDFFSEINGILNSFNYYHIYLIQNDAKIQKVEEIKYPNKLPETIDVLGRGGTDFRPVFEYLEEKRIMYPVVFFTDLLGDFPERVPPFPVLWITKDNGKAPFGITIRLRR